MERFKRYWIAFTDVAIVFSFVMNFLLLVLVITISVPALGAAFALKSSVVEPLLSNLDAAIVGLGEAEINTAIEVEEMVPIQFTMPLSQSLPIDLQLRIEQVTPAVLDATVPLVLPAQFNLPGGGGVINGTVSLALPQGLQLPIRLDMSVPVSETIPVRMSVPVDQAVPIRLNVPVRIKLGEAGLDPAVETLRVVFQPLQAQIESLPDGLGSK